jgi:hypothetical protein
VTADGLEASKGAEAPVVEAPDPGAADGAADRHPPGRSLALAPSAGLPWPLGPRFVSPLGPLASKARAGHNDTTVLPPAPVPVLEPKAAPPDPKPEAAPQPNPPPPPAPTSSPGTAEPLRLKLWTDRGQMVVARLHGQHEGRLSVLLPDGQLGDAKGLTITPEPFRPATQEQMRDELLAGSFQDFQVLQSPHYLVLYQSSQKFAKKSINLLENLYKGLTEFLRAQNFPVHDAEFPLVAVIYRTERDFRAHRQVDPEVQAYYEIFTNRIYFYQTSERDQQAPEFAALRKPQTVAHEGTHQILQNVGIHPRLSAWPLWLVEGLAEYCSSPVTTKKGAATWDGLGRVNPLHMATIRDLEDPLSLQVRGANRPRVGRDPRQPLVEYLVTRTSLTPTDYALSWAMTHYLITKRPHKFLDFLKTMSELPPLEARTPQDHLAAFRAAFKEDPPKAAYKDDLPRAAYKDDLAKMDKAIGVYLAKLKGYEILPYYAVVFAQPVAGVLKRAVLVSQSPSVIQQWLETVASPQGGEPSWQAFPQSTRARAMVTAEQWLHPQ